MQRVEASPSGRLQNEPSLTELVASDFGQPPSWPTPHAAVVEICLCLTEAVPSVESAGVVILSPESSLPGQPPTLEDAEVIGSARAGAAVLEMERLLDDGPVLTACWSKTIAISGDLSTDKRWLRFGPAIADLELHSAVAVPLAGVDDDTRAVLSVYSHHRDAFDTSAIHLITAVADIVRNALLGADLLEQTRRAFAALGEATERSRIINQAVGVLIGSGCTEDQARSRLSRMASRGNEDLAASARAIVEEASREAHLSYIAARRSARHSLR